MKKSEPSNARSRARIQPDPLVETVRYISDRMAVRPSIAVILGSGLGDFAERLSGANSIPTADIPHYPRSTVVGHRGQIIIGKVEGIPLLAFQGRVHYYETGTIDTVLYPIRVAHALGIRTLIATNAAGGVNTSFSPGDLMLIEDQINLTFETAVSAPAGGRRALSCYDAGLLERIAQAAKRARIPLKRGVYLGLKGPSYETAAEIRMARQMGVDAVGMSTVNEAALAASLGMNVAGFSCITNLATGILPEKLSHSEVTDVANMVKQRFADLLEVTINAIGTA